MATEVEGELLTPEEFSKDSGWQTVAVRRSGAKSAPVERVGGISTGAKPNDNLSAKGRRDRGRAKAKIIRGGRMPPLPKEDAKIIVRSMGGLNINKVGPIVVAEAIWNAVGIDPAKRDSDTMWPNFQENIMVVSTPCRENATRYVRVECIAVGGQQHEVNAYEAAPLSTCKGGERQIPDIAGRCGARGSSRSRNPSPSVTPGGSRSPSRERSSVGQQMKRKSTLSWADRVRGGGETGPSRGPRDPLPEQAREAEIARLQKENADLKEMVRKMAREMTEIKKLVISQSALVKAASSGQRLGRASKRRAVSSKEESVSQTNEIKGMLATLTTSVQQLHQGLAQVQVALGDPKRGLGALGDRIDALERLMIPSTMSTTPMQKVGGQLTLAAKDEAKAAFARRGAIPGVLACVDGTLIAIMKPEGLSPADTASFMSRKGYYAQNVMVVCNSELCILVVDLRLPGSGHDSWVWQHNRLCARLAAQLQPGKYLLVPRRPAASSTSPPLVDRFHNGPFRIQHVSQLLPQPSPVNKGEARPELAGS
ncbi:hypothetical protein HPB49_002700 [Dermacentor silvarum]|uniref:Uncharacterized protein n=1 Tax=Dermacentor silvarum TaxID=543639 RepID=A0ACB8CP12_DERSI|nr:hypothetical protein HPB49_002700 [Dermacentor silvarum]